MGNHRIKDHPILPIPTGTEVRFTWNDQPLTGRAGEMISSTLIANGIHIFGHHPKDHSPQGLFCANGQCSQCLVIVDGVPVKACMTPLIEGLTVQSVEGLPKLPLIEAAATLESIETVSPDVLIIGGGPAGLAAAIELGRLNVPTLLVDDKDHLGGKLVLQTHKFFGSQADSYAGTRGFEIGRILADQVAAVPSVQVWLNATAVGVFADRKIGVVQGNRYRLIAPQKLLVATGAREKMLAFPGNTLPGVYGAGAFQTLANRDLVKSSNRVLIVGGGNVGLIAGYHALQAGIEVAALIEAMPEVGGYKVHADKLKRLGVPILTRHTVVAAHGQEHVEAVTIAQLDEKWRIVDGTHRTYTVDTLLIAVGLAEVNEFYLKARRFGLDVFSAGDAQEIAEASAAMFTGRMAAHRIAQTLGLAVGEMPAEWETKAEILKARPGRPHKRAVPKTETGMLPIFHCTQEVPCNPCTTVCPQKAIHTENDTLLGLPFRQEGGDPCNGCLNCVAVCPGLAITLIDYRKDGDHPLVTLPFEVGRATVEKGQRIGVTDVDGQLLATVPVVNVRQKKNYPRTLLVQVQLDKTLAKQAVGIRLQQQTIEPSELYTKAPLADEAIICRCERITAGEIRTAIREGVRDMNQLKALNRAGMGSCGSKTCRPMIRRLFQEEGVDLGEVTDRVDRPLFVEVPMGYFAGVKRG
jgi:NADPH-dependent 2,4-dienoyl-CoA reductase/sulfur reductase-like enzyme/Fe-S-cluster-containing hydrogenase component 2/bacterioferritin-associated ferredoxin